MSTRLAALLFAAASVLAVATPSPAQDCVWGTGLDRFDIAPRTHPDGQVTVGDVVLAMRFAVGLDVPTLSDLRRADTVPPHPDRDGLITVADVIRILRVSVGLSVERPEPPWGFNLAMSPICRREGSLATLLGHDLVIDGVPPEVFVDGAQASVVWAEENATPKCCEWDVDYVMLELGYTPDDPIPSPTVLEVRTPIGTGLTEGPAVLLMDDCESGPSLVRVSGHVGPKFERAYMAIQGADLSCATEVRVEAQGSAATEIVPIREKIWSNGFLHHEIHTEWPSLTGEDVWDVTVITDCGSATIPAVFDTRPAAGPLPPSVNWWDRQDGSFWRLSDRRGRVRLLGTHLGSIDEILWHGEVLPPSEYEIAADGLSISIEVPPPPSFAGDEIEVEVRLFSSGVEAQLFYSSPLLFKYRRPCSAECGSVSPAAGSALGGTRILITALQAARLSDVTRVTFGGLPGTDLELVNDMQLLVTTPPGTPGPVGVELESPGLPDALCPLPFEYR